MSDRAMQSIAREFNLSETAFVLPPESSENSHKLRIFTPVTELPFAGHPTVGTAIALAYALNVDHATFRFEEGAGVVPVEVNPADDGLYFAELSVAMLPYQIPSRLASDNWAPLLSLKPGFVRPPGMQISSWSCGTPFLFVPVSGLDALARAKISTGIWNNLDDESRPAEVFVFSLTPDMEKVDVRARMFAPGLGIAEDPATGGAVAALAGWLVDHMQPEDGTHLWIIEQGVEMGRPSRLQLTTEVTKGIISAVRVGGKAVPVSRGTLGVPRDL